MCLIAKIELSDSRITDHSPVHCLSMCFKEEVFSKLLFSRSYIYPSLSTSLRRVGWKAAVGIACNSHRLLGRWESPVMCLCGGLAEDNARIILLAVVLAAYMLAGAALFQRLESDLEIRQVQKVFACVSPQKKKLLQILLRNNHRQKTRISYSELKDATDFVESIIKCGPMWYLQQTNQWFACVFL